MDAGSSATDNFRPSEFTSHFTDQDKQLYIAKLTRLNITDPYNAPGILFKPFENENVVPDLRYGDIYNYLINFPSYYTGESLKAFKGLQGFLWVENDMVKSVQIWSLPARSSCVITGRVNHSQRWNETPLKPWVVTRGDGVVLGAHCNCMAGLGECCSHVSALLFKVSKHNDEREKEGELAVTSKKRKWGIPGVGSMKGVEYLQAKDIIFNNSQRNKKEKSSEDHSTISPTIPPLTQAERAQLYSNLSKCCTQEGKGIKPAVLSVVRDYAESYVPKAVTLDLPDPLTNLYDRQARDLNPTNLQDRVEALFENLTVTQTQSDIVEEETRTQSKSKTWFDQRSGRITASNFRAATKTDIEKPSVSLIRKICYPKSQSFTTEATRWGCKNEDLARSYYETQYRISHQDVVVTKDAGFRISVEHPYIGASPDGYVSCSCCGSGVIEIKCPFSAKEHSIEEAVDTMPDFCLEKDENGNLRLKRDHTYYYQVQMQMFVTAKLFCDFIVFTLKNCHIERVRLDLSFLEKELSWARVFYKKCILPELIAKSFSAPKPAAAESDAQQWCYCREPEVGNMLVCMSGFCSIKRFHQTCLQIKRIPKKWICPSCRKLINAQKKK